MRLRGVPVVSGVAWAPAVVAASRPVVPAADASSPLSPRQAVALYDDAVERVAAELEAAAAGAPGVVAEVLRATAAISRDRALREAVVTRLEAGEPAASCVQDAAEELAGLLDRAGAPTAERAADVRDVGQRVAAAMAGTALPRLPDPPVPSVLVAAELAPVDLVRLDPSRVVAVVTEGGGPTGHTAVIARELDIPCVVAVPELTRVVAPGMDVLVDGSTGEIETAPEAASAQARVARDAATRARIATWAGPGRTVDGTGVRILANVSDGRSARVAAAGPVEGAGLFRTEMCFLHRAEEPSVAEQAAVYAEVLEAFGPDRTVVVRTFDAGPDKPLPFATVAGQQNPALGVRGVRLVLGSPGLLERQLDAIAAAARRTRTRPWVMAPMVATAAEAADFAAQVRALGLDAGVMVEVPAAAVQARTLVQHVDFVSIGTNDLAQYTMAADRLVGRLAHLVDAWQPAVLSLVAATARAGREADKPVGVCGEAAADPAMAAVLVGMGARSLSLAPRAVRPVGAQIGTLPLQVCERAAEAALAAQDARAAREAVWRVLSGG